MEREYVHASAKQDDKLHMNPMLWCSLLVPRWVSFGKGLIKEWQSIYCHNHLSDTVIEYHNIYENDNFGEKC